MKKTDRRKKMPIKTKRLLRIGGSKRPINIHSPEGLRTINYLGYTPIAEGFVGYDNKTGAKIGLNKPEMYVLYMGSNNLFEWDSLFEQKKSPKSYIHFAIGDYYWPYNMEPEKFILKTLEASCGEVENFKTILKNLNFRIFD